MSEAMNKEAAQAAHESKLEEGKAVEARRQEDNRAIDQRRADERQRLDRRMDDDRRAGDRAREDRAREERAEEDRRADTTSQSEWKPMDSEQGLAALDEAAIDKAQGVERKALEKRQQARDAEIAKTQDPEARRALQDEKARDYHQTHARLKDEKAKALANTAEIQKDPKLAARAEQVAAESKTHRERAEAITTGKPQQVTKPEQQVERNFAYERAGQRVETAKQEHQAAGSPKLPPAQARRAETMEARLEQAQARHQAKQAEHTQKAEQSRGMERAL